MFRAGIAMADSKDSAIKLFGKTIPLRRTEEVSSTDEPSVAVSVVESDAGESCSDRKPSVPCSNDVSTAALPGQNSGDEDKETSGKENIVTEPRAEDGEEEDANLESPSAEQSEISDPQEKTLKRPDKIIPCPRCNSMDTKFCYYNNYNVNQPRHFCKNCQRYWTAGGTMRNVPVGAGRRKNKNSSSVSHYRHLVISDALHRAQANAAAVAGPGTVLTFGGSSEKSGGDNQSSCSSVVTASTSSEIRGKQLKDDRVAQVPVSWPYPWASPAFCHSGFPVSFYPAPPQYWGSAVAAPWNVPCFPAAPSQSSLGKHSRDGEILNPASKEQTANGSNSPVLIPKTLRIDDPTEAAKSSIWATLGIKNEKLGGSVNSGGLYKMFQSKGDGKGHVLETSPVLQANPAALSRSLRFLESA